jgi:hypothetical protein
LLAGFVPAVAGFVPAAHGEDQQKEDKQMTTDRAQILAHVARLLEHGDSFQAIQYIHSGGGPVAVMERYAAVVDDLYWQKKDLTSTILMARAALQFGLMYWEGSNPGDETALQRKGHAKAIAYNLGSFTWPGWDEPGIVITDRDLAIGLDAAKLNLRLGEQLQRGPLPLSRAYWLLAAQQLAAQDYQSAVKSFEPAADWARQAGQRSDELLASAYIAITNILSEHEAERAKRDLAELSARIEKLEDGPFFVQQLDTALRALSARTKLQQPEFDQGKKE